MARSKAGVEIQSYSNRKCALKAFSAYLGDKVLLPLEDIVNPDIIGFRDHLFALVAIEGGHKVRPFC